VEENDRVLIRRFARQQDGDAFSILMDRYADTVYTTCRRILGNEAQAADAAQETFFELVKKAEGVTGSLGGWLHRVATRRAVDLIRQNASRRRREQAYVAEGGGHDSSWQEVEPVVDEALEDLPEEQRELLVLHFLRSRSTIQIAAAQGVSQPTVSRRLHEALQLLRQSLRDRGVRVALVPLQTLLLHSNHVAPETVRSALGKIALAKAATAGTGWLGSASGPLAGLGLKTALAATAIASLTAGFLLARHGDHDVASPERAPAAVSQPSAAAKVASRAVSQAAPPSSDRKIVPISQPPPRPKPAEVRARPAPARRLAAAPAAKPLPVAPGPQMPTNNVEPAAVQAVAKAQSLPPGSLVPGGYTALPNVPVRYGTFYQGRVLGPGTMPSTPPATAYHGGAFNRVATLGPGPVQGGARAYPRPPVAPPARKP
jgi:RNA polymerase sigma factor (sigma-70 family)